jgi:hypothetical protein
VSQHPCPSPRHWHEERPLVLTAVCGPCQRALQQALADLPEQYVELYLALEPGPSGGQERHGSKSPPIPLRVDVEALMRRTVDLLQAWEQTARDLADLYVPRLRADGRTGVRAGYALSTACRVVASHLDTLLAHDANGLSSELLRLRSDIRRALGETKACDRLPAPCPDLDCGQLALVRWHGTSMVTCEACGRMWSEEDYGRLVLVLAAEQRRAGTG